MNCGHFGTDIIQISHGEWYKEYSKLSLIFHELQRDQQFSMSDPLIATELKNRSDGIILSKRNFQIKLRFRIWQIITSFVINYVKQSITECEDNNGNSRQ